ncbi:MAG TPA: hypothetical protein VF272_03590 [Candidatus Saccharimonadia bacterium]
MSNMYPEWIQEQLDKIAAQSSNASDDRTAIRLAAVESRIIHHLGRRMERVEAKLDFLISCCEVDEA